MNTYNNEYIIYMNTHICYVNHSLAYDSEKLEVIFSYTTKFWSIVFGS